MEGEGSSHRVPAGGPLDVLDGSLDGDDGHPVRRVDGVPHAEVPCGRVTFLPGKKVEGPSF